MPAQKTDVKRLFTFQYGSEQMTLVLQGNDELEERLTQTERMQKMFGDALSEASAWIGLHDGLVFKRPNVEPSTLFLSHDDVYDCIYHNQLRTSDGAPLSVEQFEQTKNVLLAHFKKSGKDKPAPSGNYIRVL